MTTQYLIRIDDICPTMNWAVWRAVEDVLVRYNISPLLAVVPDNQDPHLQITPARVDFWDCVRRWQALGWTIGLHGYRHSYVTRESGLLGINSFSEFAGLPEAGELAEGINAQQPTFAGHITVSVAVQTNRPAERLPATHAVPEVDPCRRDLQVRILIVWNHC